MMGAKQVMKRYSVGRGVAMISDRELRQRMVVERDFEVLRLRTWERADRRIRWERAERWVLGVIAPILAGVTVWMVTRW